MEGTIRQYRVSIFPCQGSGMHRAPQSVWKWPAGPNKKHKSDSFERDR